jgi:uncharacterized membrane protein (DUF4010 family)
LAARGEISISTAVWASGASIGTNTLVKLGLAVTSGGSWFGRNFALGMVPAVAVFALGMVPAVAVFALGLVLV